MFWQNKAIHAVPSACSRYPPVGNGELRSKTPILSSPRNPPSNAFLPVRSFRFSHQVKLSKSFRKERLNHSTSASPDSVFSSRYVKIVAHGWTGGLTSPKFHSYAGICPFGCR